MHTNKQLLEKYDNLPKDVQEAIFSIDTAEILQKIAKENELNIEKLGILADETGLLMLGITRPNEFISNLAKRLEIEKGAANKIGKEVNGQIFFRIRESLKKIHEPNSSAAVNAEKSKTPRIIEPKNIFQERNKDQIFRSKTEETKIDPYREPID